MGVPQSPPTEITVGETYETVDTPENRFVKYFLEECFVLAQRLAQRLGDSGKLAASREAQERLGRLSEMLAHSRWAEVGLFGQFPSNSQALQRRMGNRDVVKFDLSLRLSLELPWKRGRDLEVIDGLTGQIIPVQIFVAVLGASSSGGRRPDREFGARDAIVAAGNHLSNSGYAGHFFTKDKIWEYPYVRENAKSQRMLRWARFF